MIDGIKNTFDSFPEPIYGIYRHFKGGYYVVLGVANEESTGNQIVVYQSLKNGVTWTRPLSSFTEPIEGRANPTGQKLRFEKVKDFNNQLAMISTESLIAELRTRNDCPETLCRIVPDKRWRTDYLVGKVVTTFIKGDAYVQDFDYESVWFTLEEAIDRVKKLSDPNVKIMKRTLTFQDFD